MPWGLQTEVVLPLDGWIDINLFGSHANMYKSV